jgi:hypothetical protein
VFIVNCGVGASFLVFLLLLATLLHLRQRSCTDLLVTTTQPTRLFNAAPFPRFSSRKGSWCPRRLRPSHFLHQDEAADPKSYEIGTSNFQLEIRILLLQSNQTMSFQNFLNANGSFNDTSSVLEEAVTQEGAHRGVVSSKFSHVPFNIASAYVLLRRWLCPAPLHRRIFDRSLLGVL